MGAFSATDLWITAEGARMALASSGLEAQR
jgi:hypothetical protein